MDCKNAYFVTMIAVSVWLTSGCTETRNLEAPGLHEVAREVGSDGARLTLELTLPAARLEEAGRYHRVVMPGVRGREGAVGAPVLPVRSLSVLLPYGHRVESVHVDPVDTEELVTVKPVRPRGDIRPLCRCEDDVPGAPTGPDPVIYGSEAPYPDVLHSTGPVQRVRGYTLLYVDVFPVRYRPMAGTLQVVRRARISLVTRPDDVSRERAVSMLRPHQRLDDQVELLRQADDAGFLFTYEAPLEILGEGRTPAEPFEYLIITSEALASAAGENTLQDLLAHKAAGGLTTRLVTVEEIEATQPGVDTPQKIRNFIRGAYLANATRYVLLAGDSDFTTACADCEPPVVPHRGLYARVGLWYADYGIPADCYFANLDGPFDGDGDGIWGEPTDGEDGGEVDLLPEVAVGRAPVDSAGEVSRFVQKTLAYENGTPPDLAVMVGEFLWDKDDGTPNWGGDSKDEIITGSSLGGHDTHGLSDLDQVQVTTLYERAGSWTAADLVGLINDGANPVHVFNHLGHSINDHNMKLSTSDLQLLSNGFPFFQLSQGCYPGAFDNIDHHVSPQDAIGEHLVTGAHGAFAVIQNARYGWGSRNDTLGPSHFYDREFFDALVQEGVASLGEALNRAREENVADIDGPAMRWCYYELNLLGDPETALRLGEPGCQPRPRADAGVDRFIASGETVAIGTAALPEHAYAWSPAGGLSCDDCARPLASPTSTTTYRLSATTACGTATDEVIVHVDANLPPSVGFTSPADGSVVEAMVTVEAQAGDPDGQVDRVVFGLPGGQSVTVSQPPFRTEWDSTSVPDGGYSFTATAWDDQGLSSPAASVSVVVENHTGSAGELIWEYDTGWTIHSSAALADDDTLYFGSNHRLIALRPDGTLRWVFETDGVVAAAPAVAADGTVVVGDWSGKVWGVTPAGTERFSFTASGSISSSAAIGTDGAIYVGSDDRRLYALGPDGSLRWSFLTGSLVTSSPAVGQDGTIYVGSWDGSLYALHPDGSLAWSYAAGGPVRSPAIGEDGVIYVASYNNRVHAVGPDGAQLWVAVTAGHMNGSPALGPDGAVYAGCDDGRLYALEPDGALRWTYPTGDEIRSSPAVAADGTVYVGSHDDRLHAVGPDGNLRWSYGTGLAVNASPAVGTDGTVYFGSSDGKMYAVAGEAPLADSPWPKFRNNPKNNGRAGACQPEPQADAGEDAWIIQGDSVPIGTPALPDHAYAWIPDDWLSCAACAQPVANPLATTTYTLTATTSCGAATDTVTVHVRENHPPVADAGPDATAEEGDLVALDGSRSSDPDGDSLVFEWEQIVGPPVELTSADQALATFAAPDVAADTLLAFRLTVSDGFLFGEDEVQITVRPHPNLPPSVGFTSPADGSVVEAMVTVEAQAGDPDGQVDRVVFGLPGGQSVTVSQPPFRTEWDSTSVPDGGYSFTATAWDDQGLSSPAASVSVVVENHTGSAGELIWEYDTGWTIHSSAALADDDTLYFGSNHRLIALRPDGTLRWVFETDGVVAAAPAVAADGTVVVGDWSGKVWGVTPAGTERFSFTASGSISSSAAIGTDGAIYVGSDDRRLYALGPDGSLRWSFLTGSLVTSSPAVGQDGTIYVGSWDGSLYALHPDGSLAWSYAAGGPVRSPAIGEDGVIYVASYNNRVHAVGPDGAQLWVAVTAGHMNGSPALGPDGAVYAGCDDGRLYALEPDGALRWTYPTGDEIRSSPAVAADGTVYVGSHDDRLHAVGPDGNLRWSYGTGLAVNASPAVGTDGTVYFGSSDGKMYAVAGEAPLADSPWPKFRNNPKNNGRR